MSQGVRSSRNKILIDVINNKIEGKWSIFTNHFNEEYVIPDTATDSEFRVRFHKIDISLHCMSEVERYLKFCPTEDCRKSVSLAIRLETDRAMADYLNQNKRTYKNVFAIE